MRFDPERVRALFEQVPVPDSLDRWRVSEPAPTRLRARPVAVVAAAAAVALTLVTASLALSGTDKGVTPTATSAAPSPSHPSSPSAAPSPSRLSSPSTVPTRTHKGDLRITTAGAEISDLHVTGTIFVEAPNVTLRRVRVARDSDGYWAVRQMAPNLTVVDSEIGGDGRHTVQHGLAQGADGLVVRNTVVRAVQMGITVTTHATVENSRIVDLLPTVSGFGLVCHGGGQIVARGNTIIVPSMANAALALYADHPIADVRVESNVLGGGRAALHAGGPTGVAVTGNRFRRQSNAVRWDGSTPKTWSDNRWEDNGGAVNL